MACMWAYFDLVWHEDDPVPAGEVMEDEAVYAMIWGVLPTRSEDGLVPMPGCDPRAGEHGYRLTGTVSEVRKVTEGRLLSKTKYRLLFLTAGDQRFVGTLYADHRRVTVQSGSRITVKCSLRVPDRGERDFHRIPQDWCGNWQVVQVQDQGGRGCLLDLEPTASLQG